MVKKEPMPGTFYDWDEQDADELRDRLAGFMQNVRKPEIYGDNEKDDFVAATRGLALRFDLLGKEVLYPGSACHSGVARVFGADKVLHVDPDDDSMKVMKGHGLLAVSLPIEEFATDQKFGVIVSFNAGTLDHGLLDRLLEADGFVIANNWHGSANQMATYEDFKLVGGILPSYHGGSLITDNLDTFLGNTIVAVKPDGEVVYGDAALQSGGVIIEDPRSPDALFLFAHKQSQP